jgi:hypothetical protein
MFFLAYSLWCAVFRCLTVNLLTEGLPTEFDGVDLNELKLHKAMHPVKMIVELFLNLGYYGSERHDVGSSFGDDSK